MPKQKAEFPEPLVIQAPEGTKELLRILSDVMGQGREYGAIVRRCIQLGVEFLMKRLSEKELKDFKEIVEREQTVKALVEQEIGGLPENNNEN